jgi:hypothetical protein
MFLMIFNASDAPVGGFKFCLNTKNNGTLLLDLACFERLNVIVAIQVTTNE